MPFFKKSAVEESRSRADTTTAQSPTLLQHDPHPVGFPPKKSPPNRANNNGATVTSSPSTPKRATPKHNASTAASSAVVTARVKDDDKDELRSPEAFVDRSGRRNSQEVFNKRDQTILLLDWDDTLFPTTWIRMYMGLHWRLPIDEQRIAISDKIRIKMSLDEIQTEVEKFLNLAVTKGRVIIVTLARDPWVVLSCENFFPKIGKFIRDHQIKIVYAQSEGGAPPPAFATEFEQAEYWIQKKRVAIAKELALFYQQYEGQSWKNVISIGDSDFERRATFESTKEYSRSSNLKVESENGESLGLCYSGTVGTHFRKVRTKTIKMYDGPRIKDLSLEMQLLVKWLPALVNLDSGLDCDFEDDGKLAETHRLLTGEGLP